MNIVVSVELRSSGWSVKEQDAVRGGGGEESDREGGSIKGATR